MVSAVERVTTEKQLGPTYGKVNFRSATLIIVVVLAIVVSAWSLVTVSSTFQTPSSDFVTLPNSSLSKSGVVTSFTNIAPIAKGSVVVGVSGYLTSASGSPIVGASVYMTYYFEGSYRTQVAITDQNGYFQEHFPMNWTGWLPLTVTYFGDVQHRGFSQVASVSGENLALIKFPQ